MEIERITSGYFCWVCCAPIDYYAAARLTVSFSHPLSGAFRENLIDRLEFVPSRLAAAKCATRLPRGDSRAGASE